MQAEELFPVIATVSLLLYLLSSSNIVPAALRPWFFRIGVVLFAGGMLFALVGTVFWFLDDGPTDRPAPASEEQVMRSPSHIPLA